MNGTAKVIVNQVTSGTLTSINGYLEVAGQRASVVVANPNGITVKMCIRDRATPHGYCDLNML